MIKQGIRTIVLIILVLNTNLLFSQNSGNRSSVRLQLSQVTLMAIEPKESIIPLRFDQPQRGGDPLIEATSEPFWLHYTVSGKKHSSARSISAKLQGKLPETLRLQLEVSSYAGSGRGDFGQSDGMIELGKGHHVIVYGIGASFTGDSPEEGHQLIYHLTVENYEELSSEEYGPYIIQYTISN